MSRVKPRSAQSYSAIHTRSPFGKESSRGGGGGGEGVFLIQACTDNSYGDHIISHPYWDSSKNGREPFLIIIMVKQ